MAAYMRIIVSLSRFVYAGYAQMIANLASYNNGPFILRWGGNSQVRAGSCAAHACVHVMHVRCRLPCGISLAGHP